MKILQNESLNGQVKSLEEKNKSLHSQVKLHEEQNESLNNQVKKMFLNNNNIFTFNYTGKVQKVNLIAGKYRLEACGAQGGSYDSSHYGGKGGYSVGEIELTDNTTLYVYVGGNGDDCTKGKTGGCNGGGSVNNCYNISIYGGGAFGLEKYQKPSGGGFGYVYTSETKSRYPDGCLLNSSHYLSYASTRAGNTSFPNVNGNGQETGHCGNGAAKITPIV